MNLESFTGPGSTPSRRRFWDKITAAVIASQKVAGRNISVSEHQGQGTIINALRLRSSSDTGACCIDGDCSITTEGDCAGTFQGVGTVCDPTPCQGCCCSYDGQSYSTRVECESLLEGHFTPDPAGGGECCANRCIGACCDSDLGPCNNVGNHFTCDEHDGTWMGADMACDFVDGNFVCPPVPNGACCGFGCGNNVSQFVCEDGGGIYLGDGTDCCENSCE